MEAPGDVGSAAYQGDRRQKRLARNRESARASRRRKKENLELLEEKIGQLTATIEGLRREHLRDAARQLTKIKQQCLTDLENNLLASERRAAMAPPLYYDHGRGGASDAAVAPTDAIDRAGAVPATVEAELADGLRGLSMRVGWDCRERRAVATYQLERLEGLAAPAYARFLMWLVVQNKTFFRPQPLLERFVENSGTVVAGEASAGGEDAPSSLGGGGLADAREFDDGVPSQRLDPSGGSCLPRPSAVDVSGCGSDADGRGAAVGEGGSGLWPLLCRELGLAESQEAQLRQLQEKAAADSGTLAEKERLQKLTRVLADLRVSTPVCMTASHGRVERLMQVLSPSQMVRYLCWVSRNGHSLPTRLLETIANPSPQQQLYQQQQQAEPRLPFSAFSRDGITVGGDRAEVLRLLQKPNEDLSLDEMAWLMEWVKRTQESQREQRAARTRTAGTGA